MKTHRTFWRTARRSRSRHVGFEVLETRHLLSNLTESPTIALATTEPSSAATEASQRSVASDQSVNPASLGFAADSGGNSRLASPQSDSQGEVSAWQVHTNPNTIEGFLFDGSDVWAGTRGGLLHSQDGGNSWVLLTVADDLPTNEITHVLKHDGEYYLTCWGAGVVKGHGSTFAFVDGIANTDWIEHAVEFEGDIFFSKYFGVDRLSGGNVTSYPLDGIIVKGVEYNGRLWFASFWQGLHVFDGTDWTHLTTANSDLVSNELNSLSVIGGELWIGTRGSGISVFDGNTFATINTQNSGIPSDDVRAIAGTASDVWIATSRGVAHYDGSVWTTYDESNSGLTANDTSVVEVAPDGDVWVGTPAQGIFVFDRTNWTSLNFPSKIRHYYPFHVEPALDSMWVATPHWGLSRYEEGTWTNYDWRNSPLINDHINDLSSNSQHLAILGYQAVYFVSDSEWIVRTYQELGADSSFGQCISLGEDGIAYVGSAAGLYSGSVDSVNWTRHSFFDGAAVHAVLNSPLGVFSATADGIYHSQDGISWSEFYPDRFSGNSYVHGIRYEAGNVYFCVDPGGLFVWEGGQLVEITPQTGPGQEKVHTITHDPAGLTWVGNYLGLYRENPDGQGWQDMAPSAMAAEATFYPREVEYWDGAIWCVGSSGLWIAALSEGPPPRITAMDPQPATFSANAPDITLTFDQPVDAATILPVGFQLLASGGDGTFDDGDETAIQVQVGYDPDTRVATLDPDVALHSDIYQLTVFDSVLGVNGVALDGEFPTDGTAADLPSGDGNPGGDFVAEFEVTGNCGLIFEEDWDSGTIDTSKWRLYGSPQSTVVGSLLGREGVFDNMGDASYNSGIQSKQLVDLSGGFVMESEVYLDASNPAGCWAGADITLTRTTDTTDHEGRYPDGLAFSLGYVGDACWTAPQEHRRHGWFTVRVYTEDGTLERERYSLGNADAYLDGWHTLKVVVTPDGRSHFYVDDTHVYSATGKLHPDVMDNPQSVQVEGRSSGSAGKAYHNDIRILSCASTPVIYADVVVDYSRGSGLGNGEDDPANSLGPPDNVTCSLGVEGSLTLAFSGRKVIDGPGDDITVTQASVAENYALFGSQDGVNYTMLGEGLSDAQFDLQDAGLDWVRYVKLVDLLPETGGYPSAGMDVDAVGAINWAYLDQAPLRVVAVAPEPSSTIGNVAQVTARFDQPIHPTTLSDATFQLVDVGSDGIFGTGDDAPMAAESVRYDASTMTATFVPAQGLQPSHTYAVVLSGSQWVPVIDESFDNSPTDWNYNGSAALVDSKLRLTPQSWDQAGSAFFGTPQPAQDFVAEFDFEIHGGSGADGIVFVVQSSADGAAVLGASGGGIGYQGIMPSLAVEFDTWDNGSQDRWSENHIGVNLNGNASSELINTNVPEMEDTGVFHAVVSLCQGHVTVQMQGPGMNELETYIDADISGWTEQNAYFGFTAGTGDATNYHDVDNFLVRVRTAGDQVIRDVNGNPLDGEFFGTLPSGDGEPGGDFVSFFTVMGSIPSGEIRGAKWNDSDGDGVWDAGEPGLAGWTVFLDENGNGAFDSGEASTATGADGSYEFVDLDPGVYIVAEVAQNGWTQTHPGGDGMHVVTVDSGQVVTGQDFGNQGDEVPPRITAMLPDPAASATQGVQEIRLAFSEAMERATMWAPSFALIGSGGDGSFINGNENIVEVEDVVWRGQDLSATLILNDWLPRDTYRLTALDDLMDWSGNRLDGDGDGTAGGEWQQDFEVSNTPPTANDGQATTVQDAPIPLVLSATDPDGDTVWYFPGDPPHGTLTDLGDTDSSTWLYTPELGFHGQDSFTFIASDGTATSQPATFGISVAPAPCDLEPTTLDVTSPAHFSMGDPITVHWTGINHGPGETLGGWWVDWQDRLYLSADDQLDGADLVLGTWRSDASPVTDGGTYGATLDVTLPDREWSGQYYLILAVNADHGQVETNVANNLRVLPIELDPFVRLVLPSVGRFADNETPIGFRWVDGDQAHSATLAIAVDPDDDPANGNETWIATGISEDADGHGDQSQLYLPDMAPGEYFVRAKLTNGDGDYYSADTPIQVFERAYYSEEAMDDATGGSGYEVGGIEAGIIGDRVYYRVLSNFPPIDRGGDIYINVGGLWQDHDPTDVVHGIAVNATTAYRSPLTPGDLYSNATFRTGIYHRDRPTFISSHQGHSTGHSAAEVTSPAGTKTTYQIEGLFDLSALPGYDGQSIQLAWSMYCGNDIDEVIIPGRDGPDLAITSIKYRPDEGIAGGIHQSAEPGRDARWQVTVTNVGQLDAPAGWNLHYLLSEDQEMAVGSDASIHVLQNVPAVPAGASLDVALTDVNARVPAVVNPGFYYFGAVAADVVGETYTDNNVLVHRESLWVQDVLADLSEENNSADAAFDLDTVAEGGVAVLQGQTIDGMSDADWYRFTLPANGPAGSRISIQFEDEKGDLELFLYAANDTNNPIDLSSGPRNDTEAISLEGRPAGSYLARVSGAYSDALPPSGDVSPSYSLLAQTNPPTVTITATDSGAAESGPDPGSFTITREGGDLTSPLTVYWEITTGIGHATNGTDYSAIEASVVLAAGETTSTITISPLPDDLVEGDETVTLTLSSAATYAVGSPDNATVVISDSERLDHANFMVIAPWQIEKSEEFLPVVLAYRRGMWDTVSRPYLNRASLVIGPTDGAHEEIPIEFQHGASDYYRICENADWWYMVHDVPNPTFADSGYSSNGHLPVEVTFHYVMEEPNPQEPDNSVTVSTTVQVVDDLPSWSGSGYEWYAGDTHLHSALTRNYVASLYENEYGAPLSILSLLGPYVGLDWYTFTDHSSDMDRTIVIANLPPFPPVRLDFGGGFADVQMDFDNYASATHEARWMTSPQSGVQRPNSRDALPLKGEEVSVDASSYSPTLQHHLLAYGFEANDPYVDSEGVDVGHSDIQELEPIMQQLAGASDRSNPVFAYAAHPTLDYWGKDPIYGQKLVHLITPWTLPKVDAALQFTDADDRRILRGFEFWNGRTDEGWREERDASLDLWEQVLARNYENHEWYLSGGSDDHLSHYLEGTTRFGDVKTVVVAPEDADGREILEALRTGRSIVTDGPLFSMNVDMNDSLRTNPDSLWDFDDDGFPGSELTVTTPEQGILHFRWPDQKKTPWGNPTKKNITLYHYYYAGGTLSKVKIPGSQLEYESVGDEPCAKFDARDDWQEHRNTFGYGWQMYRAELDLNGYKAYTNPIWVLYPNIDFRDREGNLLDDRALIPTSVTVTIRADQAGADYQWPPGDVIWTEVVPNPRRLNVLPLHIPMHQLTDGSYTLDVSVYGGEDHKLTGFTVVDGMARDADGSPPLFDVTLTYEDVESLFAWPFRETGQDITYQFATDTWVASDQQRAAAEREAVERALQTWADAGVVSFSESSGDSADIWFYKSMSFDELGGKEALARTPGERFWEPHGLSWRVHFATDQGLWNVGSQLEYGSVRGIDNQWVTADPVAGVLELESAALHEIGHVLGLRYSEWGREGIYRDSNDEQWSIMTYDSAGYTLWPGWSDVEALRRINNTALVVTSDCPVDLILTDAAGNVVSQTQNEIPGATYVEQDLDGDGDPEDQITVPEPVEQGYSIAVIPEPNADPDETVTLMVDDHGTRTILLDHVRIGDLTGEPIPWYVDRTPPAVTVARLVTTDHAPPLTGTIDDSTAIVCVSVAGQEYAATNAGDGTWLLEDDSFDPPLHTGVYDVQVAARDAAGNLSLDGGTDELTVNNTAPMLDPSGDVSLAAINEDDTVGNGTLVIGIVSSTGDDPITDPDPDPLEGIAVVAVDNRHGTWQYSLDDGGNWHVFGTPSETAARLLAVDAVTRVRFVPNPDFNGAVAPGMTFHAWDQTDGDNGSTADVSTNGGMTAFSTAVDTTSIAVIPANDPPTSIVLDNAVVRENWPGADIGGLSVADVDVGDTHTFVLSDGRFEVVDGALKLKPGVSLDENHDAGLTIDVTATDGGDLSITRAMTLTVTKNDFPWQRMPEPCDINGDGLCSSLDVLVAIFEINRSGSRPLPVPPIVQPQDFYDVSGDNVLAPIDILMTIQYITSHLQSEGEFAGHEFTGIAPLATSGLIASTAANVSSAIVASSSGAFPVPALAGDFRSPALPVRSSQHIEPNRGAITRLRPACEAEVDGSTRTEPPLDLFGLDKVLADIAVDIFRGWEP